MRRDNLREGSVELMTVCKGSAVPESLETLQWRTQEFFLWGGGSTNSVEDKENGDLAGGNPLVRDSGDSCNLVQEISFHIVKFSQFLVL